MEDRKGDIMVHNTPPSLPPSFALSSIPWGEGRRGGGKEERGGRRREEVEEGIYVLQFAVIKLCKFAVVRENLSIFAVIKKNVAAITPLGDFDMRPSLTSMKDFDWPVLMNPDIEGNPNRTFQDLSDICRSSLLFIELSEFLFFLVLL